LEAVVNNDMFEAVFGKCFDSAAESINFSDAVFPIHNQIVRFTRDYSYASGNFSKLREKHAKLQLDSCNGTSDRLATILQRTGWPEEYFRGKLILECGCGAGADTEVLLGLGARVVSVDLAGADICRNNLGGNSDSIIVQASIDDLPFDKGIFDIVWCHRVIMHTPNPEATLKHILQFVKPAGGVFVHSYAKSWKQMLSWKYFLRPFTVNMESEKLYKLVERTAPPLFRFTNTLRRMGPDVLGRLLFALCYHLVPIRNYRFDPKFREKSDEYMLEYAIHDTFDCLSPKYDQPLSECVMRSAASAILEAPWEFLYSGAYYIRTKVISKS